MINALNSAEAPSPFIQYIDYGSRTDGQPLYVGYALKGTPTSSDGWTIQYFTYITIGTNDFVASRTLSTGVWDGRSSLAYS